MNRKIRVILAFTVLCGASAVRGDEKLPLPKSPAPTPTMARMDAKGRVVLRLQSTGYVPKTTKAENGAPLTTYDQFHEEQDLPLTEKEVVAVLDTAGKPIPFKALAAHLKKESPAFYFYGNKIDPLHLQFLKDGSFVFCLAGPPAPPQNVQPYYAVPPPFPVIKVTAVAPPATHVAALADLLKKNGFFGMALVRSGAGHLAVAVEIDGKKALLKVNPGATLTRLDRYRLRHLELDWNDDGQCTLKSFKIGEAHAAQLGVGTCDLTEINRTAKSLNDPPMDGVLGADILQQLSAVIDHASAKLYLRRPDPQPEGPNVVDVSGEPARSEKQLAQRDAKILSQEQELNLLRLQLEAMKDLKSELDKTLQQIEKLQRDLGIEPQPQQKKKLNPPSVPFTGRLKKVMDNGEFATIDVTGDSGLKAGHTLEVFRVEPAPRYLGVIRIEGIGPNEAIVQWIRRVNGEVLKDGDHVASDLTTSK